VVKVREVFVERRYCNQAAESLSREYRHQLAAAKEDAGNIPAATHLRNMNRIESQRQLFRNIRYMEEKLMAGSTTQVTVTSPDGRTIELTTREEVEKAIMEENERKFHQTEGGSQLLSARFVRDIGKFGDGPAVPEVLAGTYVYPPETTDATKDFLAA
jgi:sensor c-di-GMP phosphodiesterase-like protein